ncbi:LytR/AlgR family response regulator transcription factor [Nannocystaceae bacterium ST9]
MLIEDEAPALAALERAARECDPGLEVLARLGSVEASLEWFRSHPPPDLILCDVMLADGLSLAIFEQVTIAAPVVFCTAYDTFWTEALARGGIDYLVKPIELDRLRQTFAKLDQLRRHFTPDLGPLLRSLQAGASTPSPYKTRLVVKRGLEFVSLPVDRVALFTTEFKLTKLVDREGRSHLLDRPLAELASELDPLAFFRANRRHLIAFAAIRSFRPQAKGRIALDVEHASEPIVVSQESAKAFREWFER